MKNRLTLRLPIEASSLSIWLIAASALAFLPGGLFRFTWPKIVVVLLAIAAGLLVASTSRLPRWLSFGITAGTLLLVAASLASPAPVPALLGRWPRYEGLITLGTYVAALVLGAKLLGASRSERPWNVFHSALSCVSIALTILALLESLGFRPLGGAADLRPGATLGNASDEGLIAMLFTSILSVPATTKPRTNWLAVSGCVGGILTTVLSGSRAALAGLLVAVLVLVLGNVRIGNASRRLTTAAIVSICVVCALVIGIPSLYERLTTAGTVTGRWLLWGQTLLIAKDHPWLGVGPSGFVDAFPSYQNLQWALQTGGDFPPDSPHLWILQALMAGGFPLMFIAVTGAVTILVFAGRAVLAATDSRQKHLLGAYAAVCGYGIGLMAGFTSSASTPLAAFILGGLVATDRRSRAGSSPSPSSRMRALVTGPGRRASQILLLVGALTVAIPATAAEWPMSRGARLAREGNATAAAEQFRWAQALRPWDSDTALLAAQAFAGPAANGNAEAASQATKWAKTSLDATPDSVEAGLALSIGYLYSGDVPAAKSRLDGLIARAPFTTGLYLQRGIANFGIGHVQESLEDLHTAAIQSPSSPEPWVIMARIYDRMGNPGAATAARSRAVELGGK